MLKSGVCRYDVICDFAHSEQELRRNLSQTCYYPIYCDKPGCREKTCVFAHNENEMNFHPDMYKRQLCSLYATPAGCPKKSYCHMAHGKHELRISSVAMSIGASDVKVVDGVKQNVLSKEEDIITEVSSVAVSQVSPSEKSKHKVSATVSSPVADKQPSASIPDSNTWQPLSSLFAQVSQNSNNFLNNYAYGRVNVMDPVIFQEEGNAIKLKMLDLMDQLCGMHYERAILENERSKTMLMQDNAKLSTMLQEMQRQQKEYLLQERRVVGAKNVEDGLNDLLHSMILPNTSKDSPQSTTASSLSIQDHSFRDMQSAHPNGYETNPAFRSDQHAQSNGTQRQNLYAVSEQHPVQNMNVRQTHSGNIAWSSVHAAHGQNAWPNPSSAHHGFNQPPTRQAFAGASTGLHGNWRDTAPSQAPQSNWRDISLIHHLQSGSP